MKKLNNIYLLLLFIVLVNVTKAQLLNNTQPQVQWGFSNTSPYFSSISQTSEDWIYGIKAVSDGGYVTAGYAEKIPGGYPHYSSAIKVNANGSLLWETILTDGVNPDDGFGVDVFEIPSGYVIFGVKSQTITGGNSYSGYFSCLLNKTTGAIITSWGTSGTGFI